MQAENTNTFATREALTGSFPPFYITHYSPDPDLSRSILLQVIIFSLSVYLSNLVSLDAQVQKH
jgi:hypothetical protein